MKTVLLVALSVLGLVAFSTTAHETTEPKATGAATQKLKVGVYYETLCPDSMRFVRNKLWPIMATDDLLQYADLEFVPYGKVMAWTNPLDNVTTLYCQHGATECELNAMHACIVEHNPVDEQLKMIYCLMRNFGTNLDECAQTFKIDISAAKRCKATRTTADILHKYGVQTDALDLTFVPTITIDNKFNPYQQRSLLYDFGNVFCQKYRGKFDVNIGNC